VARLARLAVADHTHLLLLRGHSGHTVFRDDVDRDAFLSALQGACSRERVSLHAYALLPDHVWLLCTPASAQALGRSIQALGRRFSAAFNRRHQRSGSVWDGRYRATVVEGGAPLLEAMVFVDQAAVRNGDAPTPLSGAWSSAPQHVGLTAEFSLTDVPAYWALGNTPFDRCTAYKAMLDEPLDRERVGQLSAAVQRGWAVGSPSFLDGLRRQLSPRPVAPRPRGRPRKQAVTP
jgi:putative transposase